MNSSVCMPYEKHEVVSQLLADLWLLMQHSLMVIMQGLLHCVLGLLQFMHPVMVILQILSCERISPFLGIPVSNVEWLHMDIISFLLRPSHDWYYSQIQNLFCEDK